MKTDHNGPGQMAENLTTLLDFPYPGNVYVFLLDSRAEVMWCSGGANSPGDRVLSGLPESSKPKVEAALSRCLLHGETVEYTVKGTRTATMPPGDSIHWRVRLFPIHAMDVACLGVCSVLPENFLDITDDDKDLLRYLASDLSLRQIAKRFNRSESAIDSRARALKVKLGVETLGGLVAAALTYHLI